MSNSSSNRSSDWYSDDSQDWSYDDLPLYVDEKSWQFSYTKIDQPLCDYCHKHLTGPIFRLGSITTCKSCANDKQYDDHAMYALFERYKLHKKICTMICSDLLGLFARRFAHVYHVVIAHIVS